MNEPVTQPASAPEFAIEISGLKKTFGSNAVLKHVDVKLRRGENLVVLGKSGTGKSVIIKCIVRLIEPDGGTIKVLGQDFGELNEAELIVARKKVGFLFQSAALYDSMSVRENLVFPLRASRKRFTAEELDQKVRDALKSVGLEQAIDKMPSELSGGMRKRLGLARTLILEPEIMLYDEPTTGLDAITSREISELILKMQKERETSSIIITHDLECARLTANRMVVL